MFSLLDKVEKTVGKGKKLVLLTEFSPFPKMFSNVFFCRVVTSHNCVGKGETVLWKKEKMTGYIPEKR